MSHSLRMHERFLRRSRLRKTIGIIYVLTALVYLGYRISIINPHAVTLSLVFLAAEMIGITLGLALVFSSWNYRHRNPPPARAGLLVDVLVPTYREPVDLVRRTIIAAREITYPHQTIVLDDGNRSEMRALAEELGVRYLARADNVDAKGGNLNHGLRHSTADFVMVFDADHIALPHALDVTLGFFRDERVALVQTPQDFYNIDAFQFYNARRGGLWHDQSFFYNIALPCRDSSNGASCIGTGVVYRRSALDAIGGIPVDTVTEDLHTSLKLLKTGHEVVYLNESIAYGVAAADLREFYKTRHRWAHGNIHALRLENVLFCRGLTFGQRLSYLAFTVIYLEGVQQLLLYLVPIVALLMGWAPFQITAFNVLLVLSFPLVATLLLQELGCGLSRIWVNEIFSVARFPVHVIAWAALFQKKMRFRTSTKEIRGSVEWKLMAPQVAVFLASLAAFAIGVVRLVLDFRSGPLADAVIKLFRGDLAAIDWNARLDQGYTLELVVVAGFWTLFNAFKCGYFLRKATNDARNSTTDYRFDAMLVLEIDGRRRPQFARVERISHAWFSARAYGGARWRTGDRITGLLHLPSGALRIDATVSAVDSHGRLECEFRWSQVEDRERLERSLYSVDWHREFMHRDAFFLTPSEAIGRLLRPRRALEPDWCPAVYRPARTGGQRCVIVGLAGDEATILGFQPLVPGTVIECQLLLKDRVISRSFVLEAPDRLRSLQNRGLDGAMLHRLRARVRSETNAEALLTAAE